ncbi:hypothetical protein WDW37_15210 [Bdellovibrionota bacterium FG-1]
MKRSSATGFRFLWITDSWDSLDHAKDTTLRLAEESLKIGAESYWCSYRDLFWENGQTRILVHRFLKIGPTRTPDSFRFSAVRRMIVTDFDSIHYRTDPPIDLTYLHPLLLLTLGLKDGPKRGRRAEIVNPPEMLFGANEKLEAALLGELMPKSIAASQWAPLETFGKKEGKTVLKPLHQAQSKGIELLHWKTRTEIAQTRACIEKATAGFTQPVLLQRYLSGISEGEKRLWYVDGKLLATIRKLPLPNDFRVNLDRGSRLAATDLTAKEKRIAMKIGKHLRGRGIRLAAVDLIDHQVTDLNFTSPGLIVQMEEILGRNLARVIVERLTK